MSEMGDEHLKRLENCIDQLHESMQQDIALHFQGQEVPKDFLNTYHNAVDRLVAHHPELRAYAIRSAFNVLCEVQRAYDKMQK